MQISETLSHIRLRPGFYLRTVIDGNKPNGGIYTMLREVLNNSINEFEAGYGDIIRITASKNTVTVQDRGSGIPQKFLVDVSTEFQKRNIWVTAKQKVGVAHFGLKPVNALSDNYYIESSRDGKTYFAHFSKGVLLEEGEKDAAGNGCGTIVSFTPDATIFGDYEIKPQFIESIIRNCSYFETGLTFDFTYNNEPELSYHKTIRNNNGLVDFIEYKLDGGEPEYPPVHIKGEDFEVAFTHTRRFYRRQIFNQGLYSAVNGHFTIDGGEHLDAFTKSIAQAMSKRYGRRIKTMDIFSGMICIVSINIEEPNFGNECKTMLSSKYMSEVNKDVTIKSYVNDRFSPMLLEYLSNNKDAAERIRRIVVGDRQEIEISSRNRDENK